MIFPKYKLSKKLSSIFLLFSILKLSILNKKVSILKSRLISSLLKSLTIFQGAHKLKKNALTFSSSLLCSFFGTLISQKSNKRFISQNKYALMAAYNHGNIKTLSQGRAFPLWFLMVYDSSIHLLSSKLKVYPQGTFNGIPTSSLASKTIQRSEGAS